MIAVDVTSYDRLVVLLFLVVAALKSFLCADSGSLKRKYQVSMDSKITYLWFHSHLTRDNFVMYDLLYCQCVI